MLHKNIELKVLSMKNDFDIIMYTVKDICGIFKCSLSQAYELVNANGFPSMRVGRKILVEKRALENWIERSRGKRIAL